MTPKMPGGRADLFERAELARRGAYKLDARDGCDGQHEHPPDLPRAIHPGAYVAGIDFYCDGEASKQGATGWRHDRAIRLRLRHFTCTKLTKEQRHDGNGRSWWMKGESREEEREDGTASGRIVLGCPCCSFDHVLRVETIDSIMADAWREHARRAEPRNVASLLLK